MELMWFKTKLAIANQQNNIHPRYEKPNYENKSTSKTSIPYDMCTFQAKCDDDLKRHNTDHNEINTFTISPKTKISKI